MADLATVEVYRLSKLLPEGERFGLQSQIRRAAVSAATNIVEGATRRSGRDYMRFLEISLGSASEVRYLLNLCVKLGYLETEAVQPLIERYTQVIKTVQATISTIADNR